MKYQERSNKFGLTLRDLWEEYRKSGFKHIYLTPREYSHSLQLVDQTYNVNVIHDMIHHRIFYGIPIFLQNPKTGRRIMWPEKKKRK